MFPGRHAGGGASEGNLELHRAKPGHAEQPAAREIGDNDFLSTSSISRSIKHHATSMHSFASVFALLVVLGTSICLPHVRGRQAVDRGDAEPAGAAGGRRARAVVCHLGEAEGRPAAWQSEWRRRSRCYSAKTTTTTSATPPRLHQRRRLQQRGRPTLGTERQQTWPHAHGLT